MCEKKKGGTRDDVAPPAGASAVVAAFVAMSAARTGETGTRVSVCTRSRCPTEGGLSPTPPPAHPRKVSIVKTKGPVEPPPNAARARSSAPNMLENFP